MEKLDGLSMNIEKEARERLQSVFPECFSEGTLDIDKLLTMCGEYITNDFEKYKFEWNGKGDAMKLAQRRSAACLRPCKEESVNFDATQNLYIEGDNLEVLKLLQTAYFRQVKMIYIDPPYNTGNDFVYEDDFKDPLAHYLEVTSQATKSNPETMGRFHTAWLNMMYPRLRLAANLLRDDGVIFISIDDNEVHNLRKLCDEVFGEENFMCMFTWRTDGNFDNQAKIKVCHQYILMYTKSYNDFPAPPVVDSSIPTTSKLYKSEIRNTVVKNGPKNPVSSITIPAGFPCDIENGIIKCESISWPKYNEDITILHNKTVNEVTASSGWGSKSLLENFIKENFSLIVDTKGQSTRFTLSNSGAIEVIKERPEQQSHVISVLSNLGGSQKASTDMGELAKFFDFPKPVDLLKYLVSMNYLEDDFICLDFFSGSATTAHAVMQLNKEDGGNRRFICVQLPEVCDEKSEAYKAGYKNICEIGKERIRRAGARLSEKLEVNSEQLKLETTNSSLLTTNLDTGFKVFKLDSSNIKFWDGIPVRVGDGQLYFDKVRNVIDGVKDDRPALDVVYELMLKLGVPLTTPIEEKAILDKTVYSVDGDLLLFCLESGITAEFIEALADLAPAKIIVAEMGFADDSAMANAHYILQDKGIEIKLV